MNPLSESVPGKSKVKWKPSRRDRLQGRKRDRLVLALFYFGVGTDR